MHTNTRPCLEPMALQKVRHVLHEAFKACCCRLLDTARQQPTQGMLTQDATFMCQPTTI